MVDKHKIAEELLNALDEYTGACTVVVASANPNVPHGSGVVVKYGDKQYVLTAAHLLASEPDNGNIRIIGKADAPLQLLPGKNEFEEAIAKGTTTPVFSSATPISIKGRLSHDGDDIAALEVDNLNAHLPHSSLHELSAQGKAQVTVGETITIHGFPGKLAKHYEHQTTGRRGLAAFPHVTMQIIKDVSTAPKSIDPNTNFITDFDYPEHEECDPHGMSGCGAWSIPTANKSEIWSAGKSQLLGIQIAYAKASNVLVFVRIDRVLSLLSGKS
jgi:Trypsin-like peptidase domain